MERPKPNLDSIRKALLEVLLDLPKNTSLDLFEGGYIDSLSLMDVIAKIENTFSICFEAKHLKKENFININNIAETVKKLAGDN